MEYAIDLNPRQSARTLEQAVRYQATVLLEPRMWPDADGLKGRLAALGPETLRVEITDALILGPTAVIGGYCDVSLLLGHDQFLFSTHATNAEQCGEQWFVDLARPAGIQVCQRRRFWRVKLAQSSQVRLCLAEGRPGPDITGSLCNISGEGLACLMEADAARDFRVGENVSASFELPECDERFDLDAVLCNKTPTAEQDRVILGMQFIEPASSNTPGPAQRLNEFLVQRYGSGIAPLGSAMRVEGGVVS